MDATDDRSIAFFVRTDRLAVDQLAANDKGGRTR